MLINCPLDDVRYRRSNKSTHDIEEWGEFSHKEGQIFINFNDILREIEDITKELAGENKGIDETEIHLRIYSPKVVNLTLVDLPGITKNPVEDQPENIEQQIEDIIMKYISKENSLILAVSCANVDIANSDSLKLAKRVDPNGERTLAILTKLDLMDSGTDANDMLSGKIIPVKLGIIGVINRSQQDIIKNKTIEEQLSDEKNYLQRYYPNRAHYNGVPYLEEKLSELLSKHIEKCIPQLKEQVQEKISENQKILDVCGEEIVDKYRFFANVINTFANDFKNTIDGTDFKDYNADDKTNIGGGSAIRKVFDCEFGNDIDDIEPKMSMIKIIDYIKNNGGPRQAVFAPEGLFKSLVKKEVERLCLPSLKCVDLVNQEMKNIIMITIKNQLNLKRFPILQKKIQSSMMSMLSNRVDSTKKMVKDIVNIEMASINTTHPDFSVERSLLKMQQQNHEEQLNTNFNETKTKREAQTIMELVINYFAIVKKNIFDIIPKAIMYVLVNKMKEDIFEDLYNAIIENNDESLLKESGHNSKMRNEATENLKALREAMKILNDDIDYDFADVTSTPKPKPNAATTGYGSPKMDKSAFQSFISKFKSLDFD